MYVFVLGLVGISLLIWIWLICFRGQFWRTEQRLESNQSETKLVTKLENYPSVCVVIPARNEAELLPVTLRSLLTQTYPGSVQILLVDDQSSDGTAEIAKQTAQQIAEKSGKQAQLGIVASAPLPAGWTGKLWAMEQGVREAEKYLPDYILLTDADIEHDRHNLFQLVAKAQQENLDMASIMVRLRCESIWESLLIPAFVFFFQKLYPFRWVNNPKNPTAAAAGGCILIRREALQRIGGIAAIRQALIDDCALAQAVKSPDHPIWLGLSAVTRSLRPYPSLASIWDMVARTAYTQLNHSTWMLMGTLVGMTLIYVVPPVSAIAGFLTGNYLIGGIGLTAWLLMSIAYLPILVLYEAPVWLVFCLPAIAILYTMMTLDSAVRHWRGKGGAWKGRTYSAQRN